MSAKITKHVNNAKSMAVLDVGVGTLVFAMFEDDWYRAQVVWLPTNDAVDVFFYDFGNEARVSTDMLRTMPSKCSAVPPFAAKLRHSPLPAAEHAALMKELKDIAAVEVEVVGVDTKGDVIVDVVATIDEDDNGNVVGRVPWPGPQKE